jgi:hypothetical protein
VRARFPLAVLSSLVLLVTVGLAGCNDSSTSPFVALRDEFVPAPEARHRVDGSARITFTEVAGDSRCPGDAVASWAAMPSSASGHDGNSPCNPRPAHRLDGTRDA